MSAEGPGGRPETGGPEVGGPGIGGPETGGPGIGGPEVGGPGIGGPGIGRQRIGRRSGLTRLELVITVFVVVLAVAGLAALVPVTVGGERASGAARTGNGVVRLDDAELAGPRADAALQPCPRPGTPGTPAGSGTPAGGSGTPATPGPAPAGTARLVGIEVPCLGAPGSVDLAAALAGRETLLNVWASWCVPCQQELPALQAYAARPDALPVLGVNLRDNPVTALRLLTRLKIHFPTVVDSGDAVADRLRTVALPASFLVRPDGGVTQLVPQVAYTEAGEVADAVAASRATSGR